MPLQRLNRRHLLVRQQLRAPFVNTQFRRNSACGHLVVPGQHHHVPDALPVQCGNRGLRIRTNRVGHRHGAHHLGLRSHQHRRLSFHAKGVNVPVTPVREQLGFAHYVHRPVDPAAHALAGDRLEICNTGKRQALGALQHRLGNRMPGTLLQRSGNAQNGLFRLSVQQNHVSHRRAAVGQCTRLVKRHSAYVAQRLQIIPALDQHPVSRRAGNAAHHRHWRRDHQSARACNHQQRQPSYKPCAEFGAKGQRRNQHHGKGQNGDNGCVEPGKTPYELLAGGPVRLGLLHHSDNPAQRAFRRRPGRSHLQIALPVDRSGKDLVVYLLRHRHGFSGNRRLIHGRNAIGHLAVHGNFLAGPNNHDFAPFHLSRRHDQFFAISSHRGPVGRQRHKRLQRIPGAVNRIVLQKFRNRKEKGNRRGLRILANAHGPQNGSRHQKVHVQRKRAQRGEPGRKEVESAQKGGHKQKHAGRANMPLPEGDVIRLRPDQLHAQSGKEENPGQGRQRLLPVLPERRFLLVPASGSFHGIAGLTNSQGNPTLIGHIGFVFNRHLLAHHSRCHTQNARQAAKGLLYPGRTVGAFHIWHKTVEVHIHGPLS